MNNNGSTSFFTCTGMFQSDGWSVEKATVTSPINITVNVPSMHCLVALDFFCVAGHLENLLAKAHRRQNGSVNLC